MSDNLPDGFNYGAELAKMRDDRSEILKEHTAQWHYVTAKTLFHDHYHVINDEDRIMIHLLLALYLES